MNRYRNKYRDPVPRARRAKGLSSEKVYKCYPSSNKHAYNQILFSEYHSPIQGARAPRRND